MHCVISGGGDAGREAPKVRSVLCKQAIRYLIRGASVETKGKQKLMINNKPASELGGEPVKIARRQTQRIFCSLKRL